MIDIYHNSARTRKLAKLNTVKAGSWVHAVEPTDSELDQLAKDLDLDKDILKDATDPHEVPRVEVSDGKVYVFCRYCRPEDPDIPTEPMLIVYTEKNIITVMRNPDNILESMINGKTEFLTTQKTKTFLHIFEQINHTYRRQLLYIAKQILRFRSQMRRTEASSIDLIKFIELEEDLNEFLSALQPQALVLNALESGKYMRLYEDDRDMADDIMLSTNELIEQCKSRLRTVVNIRQAYDVIATNNLNAIFKRLTAIAVFLAIPTIIVGLWGMNVTLPLQESRYGFAIILGTIAVSVFTVTKFFVYKKWL
ncbi:MAG TPA: magnesium transporter CorA family protein [Candidatus Saccharimonadales bacterium]|nr:magnesium transporter CorA family protein [Candidatus Saccharimonadales bacterium]